jgi:Flp pilus assembly pilin Flp
MHKLAMNLWKDESGQALVEYGAIVGLMAVGAIGILLAFRAQLTDLFAAIGTMLMTEIPQ